MDCKGFKRWLIFRDDCDPKTSLQAGDHRENCSDCDRLYVTQIVKPDLTLERVDCV